jgi:hypothetical protein
LTRLGFDPWQEAARLSALPRETAARVFAVTIAMLPEGDWKVSESDAIAARLVNSLPGQSAQIIRPAEAGHIGGRKTTKGYVTALAWGALAAALLLLTLHLGSEDSHHEEWFGRPVSLDVALFTTEEMGRYLKTAGFAIEQTQERDPYAPEVEYQSRRGYILASRPNG